MVERKGVILLVEDDPLMVRMYQKKFELDGYKVLLGLNGEEGLDVLANNEKPDVILLDIMMPKVDGFQFLEIVKKVPEVKDIPVILLTNVPGEQKYVEKGLSLGAIDYLVKSEFTPKQVVEKVEKVLGKVKTAP